MVGRLVHAFTHVFTSTTVLYMVGKGEYGHMVLPSSLINRSIVSKMTMTNSIELTEELTEVLSPKLR